MHFITDPKECREITDKHPDYFSFDAEKWFSDTRNKALREGDNVSFAEYKTPGVYWLHFCFDTAKGKDAVKLAREMWETFKSSTKVNHAVGAIEDNNKKAKVVVRLAGFKSLGKVDTVNGLCEMFYLTGED